MSSRVGAVAFWLLAWQLVATVLHQPLILPAPSGVASALAGLVTSAGFWGKVWFSFSRIMGGCALAYAVAGALAACARASQVARALVRVPMFVFKSTPVACVVVLLLIWLGSANVSLAAVFLMAVPGVYFALLEGLDHLDTKLVELFRVYGVGGIRRFLLLTWRGVAPFLVAASEVVVGMSWKAGVAAELIGSPLGSIGERIYQSKLLLDTPGLFAWTVVVIGLATLCEKAFLCLLRMSGRAAVSLSVRMRPRSSSAGPSSARGALSLDGVVLPHGAAAGRPVSVAAAAGGRLCVMGPSGAGKTTLLRALAGLESVPKPGCLSFDFQDDRLIEEASAFQNVAVTAASWRSDEDVRQLLQVLLPGVDADRPVSELSGGQRRRVELARALVGPGDALLLDEPFSGLDGQAHAQACAVVLSELRGRSLVVATHDSDDARRLAAQTFLVPVSSVSSCQQRRAL